MSKRRRAKPGKELVRDWQGNEIRLTQAQRTGPKRGNKPAWVAPEDMPDEQVEKVLAGVMCGARLSKKSERQGYCRRRPPADGNPNVPRRCPLHGGRGRSQPKNKIGNKHAVTHGFYSAGLFDDELELWDGIKVESVDEEIKLCKVRLRRAVRMEKRQREAIDAGETEEILEVTEDQDGVEQSMEGTKSKALRVRKSVNYSQQIASIVNQLTRLTQQKATLEGRVDPLTPQERAKLARQALSEAEASVDGGEDGD